MKAILFKSFQSIFNRIITMSSRNFYNLKRFDGLRTAFPEWAFDENQN